MFPLVKLGARLVQVSNFSELLVRIWHPRTVTDAILNTRLAPQESMTLRIY